VSLGRSVRWPWVRVHDPFDGSDWLLNTWTGEWRKADA
jgi:hypothetical protein